MSLLNISISETNGKITLVVIPEATIAAAQEAAANAGGDEIVIDVLSFPQEGAKRSTLTFEKEAVVDAIAALSCLDSFCETFEDILMAAFKAGREYERSQQKEGG